MRITTITGASGMLGQRVARILASRGHKLTLCDVVPPPLETRLTPREWGGLLDAIHDARRRHPCYRCPAVERAAYLWGWPLCGLINSCNPLCCAVYCPYVSVVERCVARMNEEILHERGVDASFDRTFDLIVFDVVEDAPRWLRL